MSFHPLTVLGTTSARMRRVLIACLLAALAIAAIDCAVHSHTAGHSHAETSALSRHATTSTEFTGKAPALPHSAVVCVQAARAVQQTALPNAPSDAAPAVAVVATLIMWPAATHRQRPRAPAIRTGRHTLTHVCRWRI